MFDIGLFLYICTTQTEKVMGTTETNKIYFFEHNNGHFSIEEEPIHIRLDGSEMEEMKWTLSDEDTPSSEFLLSIWKDGSISCDILCSNNEWSDSGYRFDFMDTIQDLISHDYLIIDNGTLTANTAAQN